MRTRVEITMSGKAVGKELSKYLKAATYREVLDGEADTLELTLQDIEGLFASSWFPERGTSIELTLMTEYEQMPLGEFFIDEIENSFPPAECKIKGTSIPPTSTVKAAEKWRAWEAVTLSKIASDIALGAGLRPYYESSYDPTLDRAEQSDESDLTFLHRLCADNGLALKLNDRQLIVFDIEQYEAAGAVGVLTKGSSLIKRFSIRSTLNEIYGSCTVNYDDGNVELPFTGVIDGAGALAGMFGKSGGKTLKLNKRVKSIGEAQRLARKKLKEKNREETKVQMTIAGEFSMRAGATVQLKEFGVFDGKYLIKQATHGLTGSGYETDLELSKVN